MKQRYPDIQDMSFARNQRYKLYRSGAFYDLKHDVLEQNPLTEHDYDASVALQREAMQTLIQMHDAARF
jgi:hypothetical protein